MGAAQLNQDINTLATLRRLYLHVQAGGSTTERDHLIVGGEPTAANIQNRIVALEQQYTPYVDEQQLP